MYMHQYQQARCSWCTPSAARMDVMLDEIDRYVADEQKLVTFGWISRKLDVSSNVAKRCAFLLRRLAILHDATVDPLFGYLFDGTRNPAQALTSLRTSPGREGATDVLPLRPAQGQAGRRTGSALGVGWESSGRCARA
eukprot:SAG11_NODE_1767_length_4282_cov_3.760220_3_plen_138_part_00